MVNLGLARLASLIFNSRIDASCTVLSCEISLQYSCKCRISTLHFCQQRCHCLPSRLARQSWHGSGSRAPPECARNGSIAPERLSCAMRNSANMQTLRVGRSACMRSNQCYQDHNLFARWSRIQDYAGVQAAVLAQSHCLCP